SGVGVLLMVTIFAFVISNNISNIIRKFVIGLKRVADGNLERKIDVGRRRDEIQTLAKSFNFMTDRLKESKELENKFDEVKMLDSLTEKINAGFTLEEVLNHVFESFRTIIPYDRIGVAFLVDNGKTVEHKWTRSDAKEFQLENGYSVKLEETTLGNIVMMGKSRIINDLKEYLRVRPQSDSTKLMVEEGMHSSLTCPLIALGKPIGFMFFSSFKANAYSNVHVELFMQIAGELAVTVEKSRLYQELMELNKLKSGFLGMAAHDLRNPSVLIRLYLNQLVDSLGNINEDQHVWIKKIQSTSGSMITLIDNFLDVSIVEANQLQLDLKPIILNAFLINNHEANKSITEKKSITLKMDLEKELLMVDIDSDRINQVINNLITNAVKYSVPNTEITLSTRVIDKEAVISVIDHGRGIHPDDTGKLFKMFGKARERPTADEKSTGLGLVICKHIVDAHGGRIWVESEGIDKGSTFKFTLPLKCKKEVQKESTLTLMEV
ncbi:MAG: ATP-binding protein, partial [Planctomycetota bacterium]